MTRSLAVVAIVLLAAAPRLTSAADPDSASVASRPDSLHARGVADTVTVLKPIEVHGVRPSVTDRPSSTTVRLDRSRLVRFAPSTVSDAFVTIPGVEISRAGPWATQVSMRGLTGERVAVLVDGVRLETGRGHGAQTSLVPIDRIEAVEAQPGTGSAINGSDALAGTIELSTHRPLFADQRSAALTLSARGAEPGGEQVEFGRLRWRSPNAGFEISGDMNQLGRLVTPDSTYAHSGYREQDVTARGAYRLGLLTADFEHSQHDAYDIQLPAFQTVNGTTASFPLQSRDADRLELSTPADSRRPALRLLGVQQHFQTWYDETNVTPHYVRGRQVSTSTSVQDSRIPMWSRSLQPSVTFGSARLFGEYRYETTTGPIVVDSTTVNAFGTPTYHGSSQQEAVPPARRTVWGAGASGALVQRGFRLDGGARWDRMRSTSDSTALSIVPATRVLDEHASGELGLSRPIGPWTPYAHVSTNFRAPNIDERFAHMIVHGGLFVFGNTALVPERSRTGEVGLRLAEALHGLVRDVRVSAYHSEVQDLITIKYMEMVFGIPRFEYRNIEHARLYGYEGQGEIHLGPVQLALAAALPRGFDIATGQPISDLGAARATFDLRLPVPHWIPQGTFTTRVRWSDASKVSTGEELLARPAFWTASAEAGVTSLGMRWTLAIRNLTNTQYTEPLSFVPEPGRSLSLGVRRELSLPWLAFAKEH